MTIERIKATLNHLASVWNDKMESDMVTEAEEALDALVQSAEVTLLKKRLQAAEVTIDCMATSCREPEGDRHCPLCIAADSYHAKYPHYMREHTDPCSGCGSPIDPNVCCCGSSPGDCSDGHTFRPMGCDCGREPSEDPFEDNEDFTPDMCGVQGDWRDSKSPTCCLEPGHKGPHQELTVGTKVISNVK